MSTNHAREYVSAFAKLNNHHYASLERLGREFATPCDYTKEERRIISQIKRLVRPKPRQCYANSQRAIMRIEDERVMYHEGYVVCTDIGIGIAHAWVTINGKPFETCPNIRSDAHYFGVGVPSELVVEYCLEGKQHSPMLEDYELGFKYARAILGDPRVAV